VILAALAAGCITVPAVGGRSRITRGMDRKPVASKEPPSSLFADDGTRCVVSEKRFREVKPGDRVWCMWM
jgi:hypothetical protein